MASLDDLVASVQALVVQTTALIDATSDQRLVLGAAVTGVQNAVDAHVAMPHPHAQYQKKLGFKIQPYAISGAGPYTLDPAPNGGLFTVALDGSLQKPADIVLSESGGAWTWSMAAALDPSFYATALAIYSHD